LAIAGVAGYCFFRRRRQRARDVKGQSPTEMVSDSSGIYGSAPLPASQYSSVPPENPSGHYLQHATDFEFKASDSGGHYATFDSPS
jgi:hypothetical protein